MGILTLFFILGIIIIAWKFLFSSSGLLSSKQDEEDDAQKLASINLQQLEKSQQELRETEEALKKKLEEWIRKLESPPPEPIEVYKDTAAYTLGSMYLSSKKILGTVITFKYIRGKYTRDIQRECEASILKSLQDNGFLTYVMKHSSDGDNPAKLIFEPGDIGVSADAEVLEAIKGIDKEAGHLRVLK